jgi:hypothetical protein
MNKYEYSWDITAPMVITITHFGKEIMRISANEIIESCSRKDVLNHVRECDNTPWLKRWNDEKHQQVVDILKGV